MRQPKTKTKKKGGGKSVHQLTVETKKTNALTNFEPLGAGKGCTGAEGKKDMGVGRTKKEEGVLLYVSRGMEGESNRDVLCPHAPSMNKRGLS